MTNTVATLGIANRQRQKSQLISVRQNYYELSEYATYHSENHNGIDSILLFVNMNAYHITSTKQLIHLQSDKCVMYNTKQNINVQSNI